MIILTVSLTGCDPLSQPDSLLYEYIDRLGRVLDVEPQSLSADLEQRLPSARSRQLEISRQDINVLEFLSLNGCELQIVIAERNSILGRVLQPLNLLRHELRFIETAQACLNKIDNQELHSKLFEVIEDKKEVLPLHIWNATWGTEEMASLLSQSEGLYPFEEAAQSTDQLGLALAEINMTVAAILAQQYQQNLSGLGEAQQRWQYNSTAGQLINSARLITSRLNQGTHMLNERIETRPICYENQPNPQGRLVQSLFLKIYIGHVQPYLSTISRKSWLVFAPLKQLTDLFADVMPQSFQAYYERNLSDQPGSVWDDFNSAVTAHTESWQNLLQQCGMRPQP